MKNIPEVKLGIIAVSRDCFPIALSISRREAIVKAYGEGLYECKVTVENEKDMLAAVEDVKAAGCNALTVFLGNFGPETPETLIAKMFDGPVMFLAAAEGDGDLINGRGDAYCGMLNCSYNLGMRHLKGFIPEYPVVTAEEAAAEMRKFLPIARAIIGINNLKIITFGPVRRTSLPATRRSKVSMNSVSRSKRTPSWICSFRTKHMPAMPVSRKFAKI